MKKLLPVSLVVLFLGACAKAPEPIAEKLKTPKSAYLVYVTNEGSGDMTVIDPDEPNAVATIPLGKRPRGIHALNGMIYVALSGSPAAPPGVDESTLPGNLIATHRSLFDGTLQGLARTDRPAFSFQGHPEASPGPHDVGALFEGFTQTMIRRLQTQLRALRTGGR